MSKTKKPNVLMFIPHDCGDHLSCYGHKTVKSPNLDRLAANGVKFTNCFTTAPECTASRSGLYTGLYTHQNGLMGLAHRGWEFNKNVEHLALKLWKGGYETYLFGFQHETHRSPQELGYNRLFAQQNMGSTSAVCDEVVEFIEQKAFHREGPWFACVGIQDTHRPWRPAVDFGPDDVEVPPYLPDNLETRADLAEFYQAVFNMDKAIGKVLDTLEGSDLEKNTVVIYTTDHGIPFPRAKSTYYDPGIHVPMIFWWKGRFEGGKVYNHLISNLDYTPTILELCGLEVPAGLEGQSFLPLLESRPYKEHEAVFGVSYYDARYDPMCYVRTKHYKYIRSFAVRPEDRAGADPEMLTSFCCGQWIRADDTDVQSSPTWQSMKKEFPPPPPEELYNLDVDPLEQNNLVEEDKYADVLENLRKKLDEMMQRTNSPLLTGHASPELSRTGNKPW